MSDDAELSPEDASAILGMSRPLVRRRMDLGILPFRRIGAHRRLRLSDVLALKRQEASVRAALNELQADTDELRENVSDAGVPVVPVVVYDANLLYPFHLRNLLIQLGANYVVSPRWTDAIHDEWIKNLAAAGRQTRERLLRTRDLMQRVLPEADVRGYEHRIESLTLPDPEDRHVLAAAIEARAGTIPTFNLRHFPASSLAPYGIVAREPDEFLCELFTAGAEAILALIDAARRNLSKTEPPEGEFIDALERQALVKFAALLRSSGHR